MFLSMTRMQDLRVYQVHMQTTLNCGELLTPLRAEIPCREISRNRKAEQSPTTCSFPRAVLDSVSGMGEPWAYID